MAKLLLQRATDAAVGVHFGSNRLALTAPGDGVSLWSAATLTKLRTLALGPGGEELAAAAALCDGGDSISALLADSRAGTHVLVTCPAHASRPSTLSEASPRLALPSRPHSLHVLGSSSTAAATEPSQSGQSAECIVVVLQDGGIAWTTPSSQSLSLNTLRGPSAAAGEKLRGAASASHTLATLHQGNPGSPATLRLYAWRDGGLSASRSLAAPAPTASAAATQLCLAPTYALVAWSSGTVSILPIAASGTVAGAAAAPAGVQVRLSAVTGAPSSIGSATSGEPSSSATPASQGNKGGSKKRPAAATTAAAAAAAASDSAAAGALVAPFDDTQFLVAWLLHTSSAGGAPAGVRYALVDCQYGCTATTGHIPLNASLLPAPGAPCRLAASAVASAGLVVLQAGRAVLGFRVQAPRASLLGLVGKMSLTAPSAAPAPAPPAPAADGKGPGKASAEVSVPAGSVWSLDVGLLSGKSKETARAARAAEAASKSATVAAGAAAAAAGGAGEATSSGSGSGGAGPSGVAGLALHPVGTLPLARGEAKDAVRILAQLEAVSAAAEAAAAARAAGGACPAGGTGAAAEGPEAEKERAVLDQALALVQARSQAAAPRPAPARLATLLARRLSAVGRWDDLGRLLATVPLQSLQGCSALLPAAAAAQFRLLAPLCCKLDEVQPGDVLAALQVLLSPTTAENQAGRRAYYLHLRSHAEAAVAHAEAQLPRCQRSQERRDALAFAQCAAALLDGFTYREVLLHPILAVPLDAPALQTCLARLSNSEVDRLLTYLSKWVERYTQKLGEGAAHVPLPQELLFPTLAQVLDWLRLTLDAHTARLLMSRGSVAAVPALERCLRQQLNGSQQLLPLLGTVEHIEQQAPLPAAHVAAATQYTVELLDLRIRTP